MKPKIMPLLPEWSKVPRPVIGMIHLGPLPGSPRFDGNLGRVIESAMTDAEQLAAGGVHAMMIENYGDTPFLKGAVAAETIAHMSVIALAVRSSCNVPLGINVLRNDACAAMAIADAVGAQFIRVNVLCGARVTDQGVIEGVAAELLRLRSRIDADVRILADVNVKHSAPLGPYRIEDEAADAIERGGADALIVTGPGTGRATSLDELRAVKKVSHDTPVVIGSGVTAETIADYAAAGADGFIVGTSLKTKDRVDAKKVKTLIARA